MPFWGLLPSAEMIGVERVRELNIIRSGRNIVYELEAGETPGEGQLYLGNGLYLDTHQSSIDKDPSFRESQRLFILQFRSLGRAIEPWKELTELRAGVDGRSP